MLKKARNGVIIGVLLLLLVSVPQIQQRVVSSMTHAGALCMYPLIYLGSIIVRPFGNFYQRVQFFYNCEELYCRLFFEYRTLLDQHTRLVGEFVHGKETTPFVVRYGEKDLFSRVLMRRYDSSAHRILIDYGTMAGVHEDLPILDGFSLVGRVCSVSPLYAWVQTISDLHARIPVYIGPRAIRGIYQGTGDIHRGQVLYVSHLEPVALGDIVLTAGDGGIYPEGFAVGRISGVEKTGFTYVLDVALTAHLESLDRCAIYRQAFLPPNQENNAMLQSLTDDTYEQFVDDVSSTRPYLKKSNHAEWANGRIFTGRQAVALNLADELGTRESVEQIIRKKVSIDGDIQWVRPRDERPLITRIFSRSSEDDSYLETFFKVAGEQLNFHGVPAALL